MLPFLVIQQSLLSSLQALKAEPDFKKQQYQDTMSNSPSAERMDGKGVDLNKHPSSLSSEDDREAQIHLKTFLVIVVSFPSPTVVRIFILTPAVRHPYLCCSSLQCCRRRSCESIRLAIDLDALY